MRAPSEHERKARHYPDQTLGDARPQGSIPSSAAGAHSSLPSPHRSIVTIAMKLE
jgi:hypothetical protein